MNLFEVKTATIKLEPGLDWQWSGWNGEITIDVQQTTFQIDGNNGLAGVILPSDIQASSTKLIGKAYTTNTHSIPGMVSVALLTVTDSTLCDFVVCENQKVALKTTEGNFTMTVIPARTSSIPPTPDPIVTKTGTWKFVDAPQSIAGIDKKQEPNNEPEKRQLLKELEDKGIKHTPENILRIGRMPDGKIVFLETGNEKAGFKHIIDRHEKDFENQGIMKDDISDVIMQALTQGQQDVDPSTGEPRYQNKRPIYKVNFGEQERFIAITVSNNGFIVGANPTSNVKKKKSNS
jgi:hypothetical protein